MADKNQATNMYVDWTIVGSSFDMILVDFYCEIDAENTYWAVHNWNNGYAGFQNKDNTHVLLFSLWDNEDILPDIEYYTRLADTDNFDFEGEGTGKHIFTNFNWTVQEWYGMAIATKSFDNNTFYAQWIYDPMQDEWMLMGIIRLPRANYTLNKSSVFQEDFTNNKQFKRRCRVSQAYGRTASTQEWQVWNTGVVRSCYYPILNSSVCYWDTNTNCFFSTGSYADGEYVTIQAGGDSSSTEDLPYSFNLLASDTPVHHPEFPCCIKSFYSNLYVAPGNTNEFEEATDNTVIQRSKRYWWNIVDAGNGFKYIKTTDNSKALCISATDDGADLTVVPFDETNNNQKWIVSSGADGISYIRPQASPYKAMDVEGPSMIEGAVIQIWTYNATSPQFKWYIQ